jgi:hypothetical protein
VNRDVATFNRMRAALANVDPFAGSKVADLVDAGFPVQSP